MLRYMLIFSLISIPMSVYSMQLPHLTRCLTRYAALSKIKRAGLPARRCISDDIHYATVAKSNNDTSTINITQTQAQENLKLGMKNSAEANKCLETMYKITDLDKELKNNSKGIMDFFFMGIFPFIFAGLLIPSDHILFWGILSVGAASWGMSAIGIKIRSRALAVRQTLLEKCKEQLAAAHIPQTIIDTYINEPDRFFEELKASFTNEQLFNEMLKRHALLKNT